MAGMVGDLRLKWIKGRLALANAMADRVYDFSHFKLRHYPHADVTMPKSYFDPSRLSSSGSACLLSQSATTPAI